MEEGVLRAAENEISEDDILENGHMAICEEVEASGDLEDIKADDLQFENCEEAASAPSTSATHDTEPTRSPPKQRNSNDEAGTTTTTTIRRIIRRFIPHPVDSNTNNATNVSDPSAVQGTSHMNYRNDVRMVPPAFRRKRTPQELFEHQQSLLQSHQGGVPIPGPTQKRGRRAMHAYGIDEPMSRTEAARRSGRPTVLHPSGVEFAIPISLEAHPVPLSDTIPDNASYDILKVDKGMPYCTQCHSVLKSWHAIDYHIMNVHLKYRPYRCMYCIKEFFFTEEECKSHIKASHNGKPLHFIHEVSEEKEAEAVKFYQAQFIMIREWEDATDERAMSIQQTAFNHMQRFQRMRFKVPEIVARQKSQRDYAVQTHVTMAAPQTMISVPCLSQSPYVRTMHNPVKIVQLANGEYARVSSMMPERYIMTREMEREMEQDDADGVEYENIDVDGNIVDSDIHYE